MEYNDVLRDFSNRERTVGRDRAAHPGFVAKVLADLDAVGPSVAGDVIQSLVFSLQVAMNRAEMFAEEWHREKYGDERPSTTQPAAETAIEDAGAPAGAR